MAPSKHKGIWLLVMSLVVAVGAGLAATTFAQSSSNGNSGDIKVHDGPTAQPETRNEPHVHCEFYVEGFNMKASAGNLTFYDWPPTGSKQLELTATWAGILDADGKGYHYLAGPFSLPDGHHRVESTDNKDPATKNKMFWVECQPPATSGTTATTTTVPTSGTTGTSGSTATSGTTAGTTAGTSGTTSTTRHVGGGGGGGGGGNPQTNVPTASVPVFPNPVTMALGSALALAGAFAVMQYRRK